LKARLKFFWISLKIKE